MDTVNNYARVSLVVNHSTFTPAPAISTSSSSARTLSGFSLLESHMSNSALRAVIGVFHRNPSTTLEALSEAFTADYSQFAKANNREPLNRAIESLNKSKADKAISEAVTAGYKAGALVTGYVGAHSGPFAKQPESVQAGYIEAIAKASADFRETLEQSGAFVTKAPRTDAEKAEAKAKAKAKSEEIIAKAINEKIQAGELFHADSVGAAVTLDELSTLALIDELAHRNLTEAESAHLDECFGLDLSRSSLIEAQRIEGETFALANELADELAKAKAEALALADELAKAKAKATKAKAKAKAEAIA